MTAVRSPDIATADELLAVRRPEDLFAGDLTKAKQQFRELSKRWHPDRNPGPLALAVFQHINALHDLTEQRVQQGLWEGAGELVLWDKHGGQSTIGYLRALPTEVGRLYIGDDHLTYVVEAHHRSLWQNADRMTRTFPYADDPMRSDLSRYMPTPARTWEAQDGRLVYAVPKARDLLLLRDVLGHFGGVMPPRHAAWIISRLCNLVCYLSYAQRVHHNLSLDTIYISPAKHSAALLGGWWYAATTGSPITQVPERTHTYLPWVVRTKKQALVLTDLELVRVVGRELLGDASGKGLTDQQAPGPVLAWLKGVAFGTPIEQYRTWDTVLTQAFGPRRFVKMDLTADMLYPRR